jgi:hypothetical protein
MAAFSFFSIVLFFLFTLGTFDLSDILAEENACLSCHVELKGPSKSIHAPLTSGCQTCHTLSEGVNHPEQKDSIKLVRNALQSPKWEIYFLLPFDINNVLNGTRGGRG